MEGKATISNPKTGKSYNRPIETDNFIGKKLGETVSGSEVGLDGYELQFVGGSDNAGFPMRHDIPGHERAQPLLTGGVGIKLKRKGLRIRKTVMGREVGHKTAQLNFKIIKEGPKSIEESFGIETKEEAAPQASE